MKEKQIHRKLEENGSNSHSALIEASRVGLALDFEQSESSRRLRLVLRELLHVMNKVYLCVNENSRWITSLVSKP